jgi:hypothetical protein
MISHKPRLKIRKYEMIAIKTNNTAMNGRQALRMVNAGTFDMEEQMNT